MPVSPKDASGAKSVAAPLVGALALIGVYCLLADWQQLPGLISTTLSDLLWLM